MFFKYFKEIFYFISPNILNVFRIWAALIDLIARSQNAIFYVPNIFTESLSYYLIAFGKLNGIFFGMEF